LLEKAEPGTLSSAVVVLVGDRLEGAQGAEWLREAQRGRPGDFWINFRLGLKLASLPSPRYEESIQYFRAALAIRPDSAHMEALLGCSYGALGDFARAELHFQRALRLDG